jgi:hypothetical protein
MRMLDVGLRERKVSKRQKTSASNAVMIYEPVTGDLKGSFTQLLYEEGYRRALSAAALRYYLRDAVKARMFMFHLCSTSTIFRRPADAEAEAAAES